MTSNINKLIENKIQQILKEIGNEINYKTALEELSRRFRLTKREAKLILKEYIKKHKLTITTKKHKKRYLSI